MVFADETAVVRAEREAVPEEPPEEASDRGIKHVLEQDIGGILLLHNTYLEHREPGLHEEDQGSCGAPEWQQRNHVPPESAA